MTATAPPPVILYHYSFSPYARRVVWYLRLRRIPYRECLQPPTLPRPWVALLGLKYRRIPILSIGRDVYLDSRLILTKLTRLFPSPEYPSLAAPPGTAAAGIERLFSAWATDAGLFTCGLQLIPGADLPLVKEPAFQRDRADYTGSAISAAEVVALRPEAMSEFRDAMDMLETTFLADGREWILGGQGPTLADIEAVWLVHWLTGLKGAVDEAVISARNFPKVYAWVGRFQAKAAAVKGQGVVIEKVGGEEAKEIINESEFVEEEGVVDGDEPLVKFYALERGQKVEVWPVDSGSAHIDTGRLVSVDAREIVWETDQRMRVHAPRHGFRIRPVLAPHSGANL